MDPSYPIGVFDSGIGGLTVLKQLLQTFPHENFIYFGDTLRVPYGDKSPEKILQYSLENANFLLEKKIKILVIACNTASAYAFDVLTEKLPLPVIDVIEPGVEAIDRDPTGIAILGTRKTIESRVYQRKISEKFPDAHLYPIACPLLVPLVEEKFSCHPAAKLILEEYLKPIKHKNIGTILLACTHYPMLKTALEEIVGPSIKLIDSASSCARKLNQVLNQWSLYNPSNKRGIAEFYVSDEAEKFQQMAGDFLGFSVFVRIIKIDKSPFFTLGPLLSSQKS